MDKKILILLPIWQREKITKICFDNLKELQKKYNIDVLCIVSETWAKMLAFEYEFKFISAPNECLGTKMNIGVKEALKYDFDYLMNLGSDDIITDSLFKCYEPYFADNLAMFGSTRATFIDSQSKEVKTFDYKILIGAGRCIRKDVLIDCVENNGEVEMYDKIQIGLDHNSMKKFKRYSHTEIKNPFNSIFDIKSDVNIWYYKDIRGELIDFEKGTKELSTEQIDAILDL